MQMAFISGRGKRTGITWLLGALLTVGGCNTDKSLPSKVLETFDGKSASASAAEAPPRTSPATYHYRGKALSDPEMWDVTAKMDTTFAVGLKQPGTRRGVYHGEWFVSTTDVAQYKQAIQSLPAVELVSASALIPMLRLKARSVEALQRIRALPFVDYIEPALIPAELLHPASFGGCDGDGPPGEYTYDQAGMGDALPRSFVEMRVDRAWAYSDGRNVRMSILDTGTNPGNGEVGMWFRSGLSMVRQDPTTVELVTTNCPHGTYMAGLAAAPRNGGLIVGAAWNADLQSIAFETGVANVVGYDAETAIEVAVLSSAKVVLMAFGVLFYNDFGAQGVEDAIEAGYYQHDVFFVGAAGTSPTWASQSWVVFPARLPEVFAVSSADFNGIRLPDSHWGPELDAVAYGPSTTINYTGTGLRAFGGSSNATAVIGGIAALLRSRFPFESNAQIRNRILAKSGTTCGKETVFGPIVNAEAAAGGLCVAFGRPLGPTSITFDRAAYGDTRTQTSEQYCINASGGAGALEITWGDGSHSGCKPTTFLRGTYVQRVQANVRDLGVGLSASTFYVDVQVVDLDNNPGCPECLRPRGPQVELRGVPSKGVKK